MEMIACGCGISVRPIVEKNPNYIRILFCVCFCICATFTFPKYSRAFDLGSAIGIASKLIESNMPKKENSSNDHTTNAKNVSIQKSNSEIKSTPPRHADIKKVHPDNKSYTLKTNDVMGIRVGMSVKMVGRELNNKFPSFSNFPIQYKGYGHQWTGIYASLPPNMTKNNHTLSEKANEATIVDFSTPPLSQKVIAVERYKRFPINKTPSLLAVEKDLREKYGPWRHMTHSDTAGIENYYFWGPLSAGKQACLDSSIVAPYNRFQDLINNGSNSVYCQNADTYNGWGLCIKPVSKYLNFQSLSNKCGTQAAAYVGYEWKGSKATSPVTEIVTFVIDVKKMLNSEKSFSKLAKKYNRSKNAEALKAGGMPQL